MYGCWYGDIAAVLYFLAFQAIGFFCINKLLYRQNIFLRLVVGSTAGTVLLQWIPALCSLAIGFTKLSHIAALIVAALLVPLVYKLVPANGELSLRGINKKELWAFALIVPLFAAFTYILCTHTVPYVDGAIHTGQATYGDMNMHLGFITSTAVQGIFPPEYSILPGTPLNYPFLCDTVSASLYVFGCSLRLAYILPMLFACLQAFGGFYLLARTWLGTRTKAMVAFTLFFLCGGFGFIYFLDDLLQNPQNFLRIFTAFYETPTNLVTEANIRWVNVIADMMIPQRATLFGWAVLFPTLAVLYKAVFEGEKQLFLPAGILAGAMPMIHTHSFLALGIICACWLLWDVCNGIAFDKILIKRLKHTALAVLITAAIGVTVLVYTTAFPSGIPDGFFGSANLLSEAANLLQAKNTGIYILIIGLAIPLAFCIYLLFINIKCGNGKKLLGTWGLFLGIVLVLAVPQLIKWTFAQVATGSMLRPVFNWGNTRDTYIWYYVKNIGLVGLLAIPALVHGKKTVLKTAAPALLIWFIAELVVFQPNNYDNNKLLYPAYALICCAVAGYMVDIYTAMRINRVGGRRLIAVLALVVCTLSGVLTIGREAVSDYELYGNDQLAAAEFIQDNTPADAVILTGTRHNNAVSSLTGRNIVCGSSSFLYYHGLDYTQQENDVARMYNNLDNTELLQKYNVDYIFISAYERGDYRIDESKAAQYTLVYNDMGVRIYAVSVRANQAAKGENE